MPGSLSGRLDRLERPQGIVPVGIAERLRAARERWHYDPQGKAQDAMARRQALRDECQATLAAGRPLNPVTARILRVVDRTEAGL